MLAYFAIQSNFTHSNSESKLQLEPAVVRSNFKALERRRRRTSRDGIVGVQSRKRNLINLVGQLLLPYPLSFVLFVKQHFHPHYSLLFMFCVGKDMKKSPSSAFPQSNRLFGMQTFQAKRGRHANPLLFSPFFGNAAIIMQSTK